MIYLSRFVISRSPVRIRVLALLLTGLRGRWPFFRRLAVPTQVPIRAGYPNLFSRSRFCTGTLARFPMDSQRETKTARIGLNTMRRSLFPFANPSGGPVAAILTFSGGPGVRKGHSGAKNGRFGLRPGGDFGPWRQAAPLSFAAREARRPLRAAD